MKQLCMVLLLIITSEAFADDVGYAKLFMGTVDSFRDNHDTQYGVEYEFANGLTRYDIKPALGLMRTRHQSHFLYTSLNRTSKFTQSDTGLVLNFSLGTGLYLHGGGNDTDLGSWFELRTSAGLLWLFADDTRLGVHFAHLSNASVSKVNPGTELVTVTYELPF